MGKEHRIAFIARCDLGGIGIESRAFVKHMKPDKVMVVMIGNYPQRPEDFPGAFFVKGNPTDEDVRRFLYGMDSLFCIETPYNRSTFEIARKMGVKTFLRMNYEWHDFKFKPDVLINPVDWHTPPGAIVLPFPVDTEHYEFRQREKAKIFLHIAGHNAGFDRNGTDVVLKAAGLVKSDAKFIVYSQSPIPHKRQANVQWRVGDFLDNKWLYNDADVMVLPRKYAGQALSMNEALACGVPVLMTDMEPQNKFLPKEWLIEPTRMLSVQIAQQVEYADIDPQKVAQKIDEWYNQNLWQISKKSRQLATSLSWTELLPRYQALFR